MSSAPGVETTNALLNRVALYVLPPVLLYFVMAVLAITPHTRFLRVACWPVLAYLAFRAAISMDMSLSNFDLNPMLMIVIRSLYWALAKEPLVRHLRPANSTPSTLMDAIDLGFTFRGYGWDWSRGLQIPPETRPSSRTRFISYVALSAVVHALMCGVFHRAIRSFSPDGLGSISGASIFDESLPFHLQYLRSSIITILGFLIPYSFLQTCYDLCTMVGVLFLGQDPAQWPPAFDSPWLSTSVAEFWGRRWHQWLRHMFLVMGGYPLSFGFSRMGFITGAFLASGVYHHVGLYSLNMTNELWKMLVGFGMMAPGIFAEQAFKQLTKRKVCGLAGWVWTMVWVLLWGNLIIDGCVRGGLFRPDTFIDGVPYLRALAERLVRDFDTWLHV